MQEREYLINLFEYYKNLLTDNQKNLFIDYYFDNLTMDEIKDNRNISKNAVSKQIKIIKDKLFDYENKLKLYDNKINIENILKEEDYNKIINYI